MEIIIIGSACAVSDGYMEFVEKIADELNLDFTIRKTESEEDAEIYGIELNCLLGYCPGCHALKRENPDVKQTPALVIDGELVFHSGYPGNDAINTILKEKS